jgi:exodeoxyribonuclease VII small subunit
MTKEPSFEEDMQALQELVTKLEQGETPLDESLQIFEEGTKLLKRCRERLQQTENRVEKIMENMAEDA